MAIWNFAFGSHLVKDRMAKVIGAEPEDSMRATLSNYRLTFWRVASFPKEYAKLAATGGFPVLVPAPGREVHGAAYRISEQQLAILDVNEAQFGYQRMNCLVTVPGAGPISAFAHNRKDVGEFFAPADEFLSLMLQGLREFGYPEDVIAASRTSAGSPM